MKEFFSILRCFLGLHRYAFKNCSALGERYFEGRYVAISLMVMQCAQCGKWKFRTVAGSWQTPKAVDSETEQLRRMAGLDK